MTSNDQTPERERAAFAFKSVDAVRNNSAVREAYARFARNLPTMVLRNGIGQALALIASKRQKEKAAQILLGQIAEWLAKKKLVAETGEANVIGEVLKEDQTYRRCERELLELASWLKQFADAFLPNASVGRGEQRNGQQAAEKER